MCWFLFVLLCCVQKCTPQFLITETVEFSYQIAGIFDKEASTQLSAFNDSLNHVHLNAIRIKPITLQPLRSDSYSVWREICSSNGIQPVAVFGPQNAISDGTTRDQCAIANIPHIQATWQPLDPDMELNEDEEQEEEKESSPEGEEGEKEEQGDDEYTFKKISINFYPNSEDISRAYGKLVKFYKWTDFAALYEDSFGLLRVQNILSEVSLQSQIFMYKLDPGGDNRRIFKELSQNRITRIVLDCHADRILQYLAEAESAKLVTDYQHYILVSMDASTVADKLVKMPANATWLSITQYDDLKDERHYLATRVGHWQSNVESPSVVQFKLESLIMDDVANHLGKALDLEELKDRTQPPSFSCTGEEEPWAYGAAFQRNILETKTLGVTGNVQFDQQGRRINYVLYVNEIHVRIRQTIGKWESANGTEILETRQNVNSVSNPQFNKEFIVVSRRAKPYFWYKDKCEGEDCSDDPNDKFEGFSVDLVKNIFRILREEKFNYTYKFVHEKDLGYPGLVEVLLDKKADLAVCDFTITEDRKKKVDFSVPFMTLGISILYTQDRKVQPGMFSFLNPYTFEVWMYTATAYCVVSIILFICARISPADWENPEPCEKDPEELENIWTFKNCTWLTMGSIMTQGCDILPKAFGTRWVCGMWWFFAVIVCQTYIAQLSASMTSALENEPINSIDDLAKQTKIRYGAIENGSTYEFFKSSKDKTYRHIYETMKANPAVYVENNDDGEKRVLKSKNKYAFFMESSTIEYKLKRNCDLKKIGGELDSKDYGIAMPANSPFRTDINRAILRLKELTTLDQIKNKWWLEKYGAKKCDPVTDENDIEGDLEMENLMGAFVVLAVGLVLCLFMTFIEFMNEVRNIVVREQVTHKEVFIKELKASLNFFQLRKPVLRNPSRAASVISSDSSERREKQTKAIENFMDLEKEVQ